MKIESIKMIKSYLMFWLMYSMKYNDKKHYERKKQEMIDRFSDYPDIKLAVENSQRDAVGSLLFNEFLKLNDVPKMHLFGLKEKKHEDPIRVGLSRRAKDIKQLKGRIPL